MLSRKNVFVCVVLTLCLVSAPFTLLARSVVDDRGVTVELPEQITKVAPMIGAFAQVTAMLGEADRIIAAAPRLPPMFWKIYPQVAKNGKNQSGSDAFSVESLIASGAQVVYGPVTNFFNESEIRQLGEAGVTVVALERFATAEELQVAIAKIGTILGPDAEKRAAEFNAYFQGNIDRVARRIADSKAETVTVLSLGNRAGKYNTVNDSDIGAGYMKVAGGKNLAGAYSAGGRMMQIVNTEQILLWDPQVIITNDHASEKVIFADPALATLQAVKNQKIFVVPAGVYLWSVRSAEGALQPLWLAKTLHPELFADIDLKKEVKNFYHRFYGYDLSGQETEEILRGSRVQNGGPR